VDSVSFSHDELLPQLFITSRFDRVALHTVCSLVKMGLASKLERIAKACSQSVFIPASSGCCGFAGARGFAFPELTEAATRQETEEVRIVKCDGYYSSSRTCEIAMTRSTGQIYRSFMHLLEEATR
jgi:D-lactate dehydrogenase